MRGILESAGNGRVMDGKASEAASVGRDRGGVVACGEIDGDMVMIEAAMFGIG